MNELPSYEVFDRVCSQVHFCTACPRMDSSQRILSRASGPLDAEIMFIGEAPGRLGADSTGIPFHGDQAGHNFESLLAAAGLSRRAAFVTNAVLCNPKDGAGRNASPNKQELENCSRFLRKQIEIVNPKIVVTLGAVALDALCAIEEHDLSLTSHVRTSHKWFGRRLIPLYHPGQRAMIHRSFANQRSDYRFVYEQLKRAGISKARVSLSTKRDVMDLARTILSAKRTMSYFALHKISYLLEYEASKKLGTRLTSAYFIRQKDGPYCTDLHIAKVKKAIDGVTLSRDGQIIEFHTTGDLGFELEPQVPRFKRAQQELIESELSRLTSLTDAELKTRAYLSKPMRQILRKEQLGVTSLYNAPIDL